MISTKTNENRFVNRSERELTLLKEFLTARFEGTSQSEIDRRLLQNYFSKKKPNKERIPDKEQKIEVNYQ